MAAEDEGRTEEPSEYKLDKVRKEGRVAKSQEIGGALVLLFTVITLIFLGRWIVTRCCGILRFYFSRCSAPDIRNPALAVAFFNFFISIIIPTAAVGAVAALVGNIIQTRGFLFSMKPLEPKFSKVLPKFGEYFKKTIFSGMGLFNVVKSVVKIAIICLVAFVLIRRNIPELLEIIQSGNIMYAISRIAGMCVQLLVIVAVIFLLIAVPDYFVQKREFMESMKMTKQEQKTEYKEMEGDPEVKSRLQRAQRELLQRNIPKAVAESDVVITNPTHFAVALKYDRETADSPKVTAKGEDQIAFVIRRIAKENGVPVVENRPVARGLYTETQVGDIIPETYYKAIALIYSHILYNN